MPRCVRGLCGNKRYPTCGRGGGGEGGFSVKWGVRRCEAKIERPSREVIL